MSAGTPSDSTSSGSRTVRTFEAVLSSELEDSGPYTIHGIAIGAGDTTIGHLSKTKKFWPGSELEKAAESLEGKPLVKDHENNIDGLVGEVKSADYIEGVGVAYEAEIDEQYESYAKKVANGRLDVSPRIKHRPEHDLEENSDGALVVEDPFFINLSLVTQGASPSNTANFGEHAELAVADLQSEFVPDDTETEDFSLAVLADPDAEFDGDLEASIEEELADESSEDESDVGDDNIVLEDPDADLREQIRSVATEQLGLVDPDKLVADVEELASYEFHEPEWDDSTTGEWDRPTFEDFVEEMDFDEAYDEIPSEFVDLDDTHRSAIESHFLIAEDGFPADSYGALKLPVVEPDGSLSLSALRTVKGGRGVSAVDGLDDEMEAEILAMVNKMAVDVFDEEWGPTEASELGLDALRNSILPNVGVGLRDDLDELAPLRETPIVIKDDIVRIDGELDDIEGYLATEIGEDPLAVVREVRSEDDEPIVKVEPLLRDRDGSFTPGGQVAMVPLDEVHTVDQDEQLSVWPNTLGVDRSDIVELAPGTVVEYDDEFYELADEDADPGHVALHSVDEQIPVSELDLTVDVDELSSDSDDDSVDEDDAGDEPVDDGEDGSENSGEGPDMADNESAVGSDLVEQISIYDGE